MGVKKLSRFVRSKLEAQFPGACLEAGDVLYLPQCWWHCVEGSVERNMILNYWLRIHPSKRE